MSVVLTDLTDNILTITLNRPEAGNALNGELGQAIVDALKAAGHRVAVIGDGGEQGALEALAGELGLSGRTRFLGHVPDPTRSLPRRNR